MRTYIQAGFKLEIAEEWIETTSLLSDPAFDYKPPALGYEIKVFSEEDAIKAVKEYFKRYNELRDNHDI